MRVLLLLNVALTLIIWALLSPIAECGEEGTDCGPCAIPYEPYCLTIKKSFANRCLLDKYNRENPSIHYEWIQDGPCECPAPMSMDESTRAPDE